MPSFLFDVRVAFYCFASFTLPFHLSIFLVFTIGVGVGASTGESAGAALQGTSSKTLRDVIHYFCFCAGVSYVAQLNINTNTNKQVHDCVVWMRLLFWAGRELRLSR
jgi:hypothetical protein